MNKLDELAALYGQRDLLHMDKQNLREAAIPTEVTKRLEEIDEEFAPQEQAAADAIAKLEAEIKADVLAAGATMKGDYLTAVFSKGRTSWDSKQLEGLMMVVPQLEQARKIGEPSVSIRRIG